MIRRTSDRLRLLYIPEREVLEWFANATNAWTERKLLELPVVSSLPKDVVVVAVHHDFHRRAFQFTIQSETFSESPPGCEIPGWEGSALMRYEVVELRTNEDRLREKWHIDSHEEEVKKFIIPDGFPNEPISDQGPMITAEKLSGIKASFREVAEKIKHEQRNKATMTIPSQPSFERHDIVTRHVERCIEKHLAEMTVEVIRDISNAGIEAIKLTDGEVASLWKKVGSGNYRNLASLAECNFPKISLVDKNGVLIAGKMRDHALDPANPEDRRKIALALQTHFPEKYTGLGVADELLPPATYRAFREAAAMVNADRQKKIEDEKSAPLPGDEADDMLAFFKGK